MYSSVPLVELSTFGRNLTILALVTEPGRAVSRYILDLYAPCCSVAYCTPALTRLLSSSENCTRSPCCTTVEAFALKLVDSMNNDPCEPKNV